ncbi:MAG: acyl-CoA/acyl-ACP dehydrogenase [Myxococcales bacterium]|nr:acyl-CoA/acyl-ACP dehydrogenase [Myxococcales bacterium]
MDFSLSEEQTAIQELARQIFSDAVSDESLRAVDKSEAVFDTALWKQLAEANLLGIAVDEAQDGMGMGLLELCLLLEEQGRHLAPVPLVPALAQAGLAIARFGSDAQKRALLPGLVAGDHWLTAALQEGTQPAEAPGTTAARKGAGVVLNGVKSTVAAADGARAIVVSARREDGTPGLFVLDPTSGGVALEPRRATHHAHVATLRLADAAAEPLGAGTGDALAFTLARARVATCAVMLGVTAEALRRTAEYVGSRKQFGKPIGTFQGVALRTADAYIDVECIRSTLWQAIYQLDSGAPTAGRAVALAKWWACRAGQRVVHSAQHLHGGIGSDVEYPIHRFFLWAKAHETELGGASHHLALLGDALASGAAA